jgi:hypothetical protein
MLTVQRQVPHGIWFREFPVRTAMTVLLRQPLRRDKRFIGRAGRGLDLTNRLIALRKDGNDSAVVVAWAA